MLSSCLAPRAGPSGWLQGRRHLPVRSTAPAAKPGRRAAAAPVAFRGAAAQEDAAAVAQTPVRAGRWEGPKISSLAEATALPQMWGMLAARHGGEQAMLDLHHHPPSAYSFSDVAGLIWRFAAGLQALGIQKGDAISLFSEDSSRWMITDQGIQLCGAVGAVRGVTSIPAEELQYILMASESRALVVQDASTLDRLLPALTAPEAVGVDLAITLWGEPSEEARHRLHARRLLSFDQVLEQGASGAKAGASFQAPDMSRGDPCTLAYTSGTGGHPKGVALTHANLLYQLEALGPILGARAGQTSVTYLPPWHMYGRTLEYYLFSCGVCTVYSNLLRLRQDLQRYTPDVFVSVPLMLDSLQSRAVKALAKAPEPQRKLAEALLGASGRYVKAARLLRGTDLRYARQPPSEGELEAARIITQTLAPLHRLARQLLFSRLRREIGLQGWAVSGGGSLATHLDDFYEMIGVPVMVGYGLTETSPVLTIRHKGSRRNVRGTIGPALPGTQLRIVDPATYQDLPDGEQGLVLAKGPGVMGGYHRNVEATRRAFPVVEGWFDTGDLGWRAPAGVEHSNMAGSISITGRAKDTIVLSSGENIEPQPIEDLVQVSPYIRFCVLVGQGHRALGALIVPDQEALEERASKDDAGPLHEEDVRALVHSEIAHALAGRPAREHIHAFAIVQEPFSVEGGTLTRTLKPRRLQIFDKYRADVDKVEAQLR